MSCSVLIERAKVPGLSAQFWGFKVASVILERFGNPDTPFLGVLFSPAAENNNLHTKCMLDS